VIIGICWEIVIIELKLDPFLALNFLSLYVWCTALKCTLKFYWSEQNLNKKFSLIRKSIRRSAWSVFSIRCVFPSMWQFIPYAIIQEANSPKLWGLPKNHCIVGYDLWSVFIFSMKKGFRRDFFFYFGSLCRFYIKKENDQKWGF